MSAAVLMIHGLGGTAYDFGSLPTKLENAGFTIYAPVLPGHGTKPEDLAQLTSKAWVAWTQEQYRLVSQQHTVVHVVGMCMGALLGCELAKSETFKNGRLVMLAPTVHLDGWSIPWYQGLRYVHYLLPWLRQHLKIPEKAPFGIKNERLRAMVHKRFLRGDSFHYAWLPLQSIWQLDQLRRQTLVDLASIQCDTLVVHSREDEFSTLRSAYDVQSGIHAKRTPSPIVPPVCDVVILENSYHMVCVDNDRELLARSVLSFLGKNPYVKTHGVFNTGETPSLSSV